MPTSNEETARRWLEALSREDFDEALALVHPDVEIRTRGARSGIELDITSWTVWTFDADGLVTRIEIYQEHEEDRAREAAARRRPV
jgi:ketosteroid isomerase-like protein